jgi:rod shape-determining protein MreC
MLVDGRFDYLERLRYYVGVATAPVQYMANLPSLASSTTLDLFNSRSELVELREELLMQQYRLQQLDHLSAENARLNALLRSAAKVDDEVMRTQLIGESPDPFVKRILIDKGARDGVTVGLPVLDALGLMGQVVEVEPFNSWVLLITDPQHATPVELERNGVRGIAAGTRDTAQQLILNNIPNGEDVQVGDMLVTSGIGGRFPPGYPVGMVTSVRQDPSRPFADVQATPTAEISRSRNLLLVFVRERSEPVAAAPPPRENADG